MKKNIYSKIGFSNEVPRVRHFQGLPLEVVGANENQKELPRARYILIESDADGFLLNRYTENGEIITDTWHMTFEEAKEQAAFEYQDLLLGWKDIPININDPIEYVLDKESK